VSTEKSSSFLPMVDPATPAKDKAPTLRGRAACLARRVVDVLDPTTGGRFYCLTTVLLLLYVLARHIQLPVYADGGIAFTLPPAPQPALAVDSDASAATLGDEPTADASAIFAYDAPADSVGVATEIVSGTAVPGASAADALAATTVASTDAAVTDARNPAGINSPPTAMADPLNPPPALVPSPPPPPPPSPPPSNTWQLPLGSACASEHKGDSKVSSCESICNPKFAKGHCSRCKCRACDFCPIVQAEPAAPVPSTSTDRDGALSATPAAAGGGPSGAAGHVSVSGSVGGAGSEASGAGNVPVGAAEVGSIISGNNTSA
jgi:hypothetical protein